MKRIEDNLVENPYIRNDVQSTQFTIMLEKCIERNNHLSELKKIEYVHGLIKYNRWTSDADIFQYIGEKNLILLQNKKIFFILDASVEGYSPFYQIPFFDILHFNCLKYNVDPSQIIFVSSNLLDEKNYEFYISEKNYKKFKVVSFNFFESVAEMPYEWNNLIENGCDVLDRVCLEKVKTDVNSQFKDKFFSSLSRINRYDRSRATFLLCQNEISKYGLISHNKLDLDEIRKKHFLQNLEYSETDLNSWLDKLPLIVDRDNFQDNWAMHTPYLHIHNQTLFQIVNETYQSNFYNTSLFYSEKTFRPIICFQPFIIYGQPNCNRELEKLGYKLYENHFNYDFDNEENDTQRYLKILEMLKDLCKKLSNMNRQEQIAWRFQTEEILKHNFNVMRSGDWNYKKITKFLETEIYDNINKS